MQTPRYAGLDGELVRWDKANVHVSTHALHYGTGVFEGIRAYYAADEDELSVWELDAHLERLVRNMAFLDLREGPSKDQLWDLTMKLLRANGFREDTYIRPLVFLGEGTIRVRPQTQRTRWALLTVPLGSYLGKKVVSCMVSSWTRVSNTMIPPAAKISGAYVNSLLAAMEAARAGYDEAIFLTKDGTVSEGSVENLFIVRKKKLFTPSVSEDILEGITRANVMEIGRDLGFAVEERRIARSELYHADEVFLCGTGAGIVAAGEIDGRRVGDGDVGPITRQIMEQYELAVHGKLLKYRNRLTPIYGTAPLPLETERPFRESEST
ncbi:MAG TPA: branched-chain amino acid transaminase [Thermoplasmata archaeon]|nr:branched-chain amino acid transaminase [Thermoplasmata archaeon]